MKKILTLVAALSLVASLAVGGSIAYLQDAEQAVNTMTLGNVDIEQVEWQRAEGVSHIKAQPGAQEGELVKFDQDQPIYPAVESETHPYQPELYSLFYWGDYAPGGNGLWDDAKVANARDKIVMVTNTGKTDAYFRTIVAFECPEDFNPDLIHYNANTGWYTSENIGYTNINGVRYYLREYTYKGNGTTPSYITAGETARPSLLQVALDGDATNEDMAKLGETWDILVVSQAVQTAGFADAKTALDTAFGKISTESHPWMDWDGKTDDAGDQDPDKYVLANTTEELTAALEAGEDVALTQDIEDMPVYTTAPYGNKTGMIQNGQTINGAGKTIDFDCYGDDYGIMTSGGTIKNITLEDVARAIAVMSPTEDIILDNVTVKTGVLYPLNTMEPPTVEGIDLIAKNSVFGGWTSFAGVESATFTNCEFTVGNYYNNWPYDSLVKPYINTVFENCSFADKYYLDLSALEAGCTVTLKNCTVNGQTITADICGFKCDGTETFCVELPEDGRTLADCVIFK